MSGTMRPVPVVTRLDHKGTVAQARSGSLLRVKPAGLATGRDGTIYITSQHVSDHGVSHAVLALESAENPVAVHITGREPGYHDGASEAALFSHPVGVSCGPDFALWVADCQNHRIRRVAADGSVTTVAGSGLCGAGEGGFTDGKAARFNVPSGLCVRPADGAVVVADTLNHRIRLIVGGTTSTLAGTGVPGFADGPGDQAMFCSPADVALCPDGSIVVADKGNNRIRRIAADASVTTVCGNDERSEPDPVDGVGSDARLTCPTSISVDVTGTAVVGESREDYLFAELRGPRTVEIASGRVGTLDVSFAFDDDEVEMTDGGEPEVRIDCFGNVLLACFEPPCLFRIANTGLNRVYLGADTPWQPTRKYHRTCPRWSCDAVFTFFLVAKRAYYSDGDGGGWLRSLPQLPTTVWHLIISLLPPPSIGRPPVVLSRCEPSVEAWLDRELVDETAPETISVLDTMDVTTQLLEAAAADAERGRADALSDVDKARQALAAAIQAGDVAANGVAEADRKLQKHLALRERVRAEGTSKRLRQPQALALAQTSQSHAGSA